MVPHSTLKQRQDKVREDVDSIIDHNEDDVLAMDELLGLHALLDDTEKAMFLYDMVRRAVYERKLRHGEAAFHSDVANRNKTVYNKGDSNDK